MPTFRFGDMWTAFEQADLFLIATNSFLRKSDASLVMGAGIAQEARERFPGLPEKLGRTIAEEHGGHLSRYGLIVSPAWPKRKLGCLQTKRHFKRSADLILIRRSVQALRRWIGEQSRVPGPPDVHVNFPGIGCGGLGTGQVEPMLEPLPACVHVSRRKNEKPGRSLPAWQERAQKKRRAAPE